MYVPSAMKQSLYPTLADAVKYLQKADKPQEARDCRDLHAALFFILSNDDELYSALNVRKVAMTSFSWDINQTLLDGVQDDSEKIKAELEPCISEFIRNYWKVPLLGIYAVDLIWEQINGNWIPRIGREYPCYNLNWDSTPDLIEVYNDDGNKSKLITADKNKFIAVANGDVAGGALRRILLNRVLRNDTLNDWANFNKGLRGLVDMVIKYDDKDVTAEAKSAMETLHKGNFAIHSEDIEIGFKDIVSAQGSNSYATLIDKLDKSASKVLNGQANTTDLPSSGGSRAALQILKLISGDIVLDDFSGCEAIIYNQIILPYWRLNKDSTALTCPYKLRFNWLEEQNPLERIQIVEAVLNIGQPVAARDVYAATGLIQPTAVGEVIEPGGAYAS